MYNKISLIPFFDKIKYFCLKFNTYMMKKFTFIFISVLIFSLQAKSQSKSPWNGILEAGASYYSGNVNKLNVKGSGKIAHTDSVYEFSLFTRGTFSKVDSIVKKKEYSVGMKYDFRPFAKLSPFILTEIYSNQQKGIEARYSGLAGVKYTYYKTEKSAFSLSTAFQYDYDTYLKPKDDTETQKPDEQIIRLSIRPKFKQKIAEGVYFEHQTFFQPSLKGFDDYRIYSKTRLSTKFLGKLSVNIDFIYEFDEFTAYTDIKKDDSAVFVTFVYKF